MPALVLDAQWNVLRLNRCGHWLAATLMPWATHLAGADPVNMLDLLTHPEGLLKSVVNLQEVGPALLVRLRQEAITQPAIAPKVDALAALLSDRLGPQFLQTGVPYPAAPVLTTRYATPYGELSFFAMFTTFGTPQDITLASLRVEHLFAADALTRAILVEQVPSLDA